MEQNLQSITGIFDSHAHYDDNAFQGDREVVIDSIHKNSVCGVINIGCDLESSKLSSQLADQYNWFYASAGIHPGNANNYPTDYLTELDRILRHPKMVAVGEIGLDYHYEKENKEQQKRLFCEQMELAQKHSLPVIIHAREATADLLEILNGFPANGVVHCYTGSPETANKLVKMGYYIGITGVVTFPNAKKVKQAVIETPLERLLLETDCPYMAPVPFRGKRCTSDMIRHTAAAIAELKGVPVQQVVDTARNNTKELFKLKG